MALSNAEKQRNYRQRSKEKRDEERRAVAVMPAAEHEAFKAKARQLATRQRTRIAELEEQLELREQITALRGQLAGLEEQLSGGRWQTGPNCRVCGGQLACPPCSRGDDL